MTPETRCVPEGVWPFDYGAKVIVNEALTDPSSWERYQKAHRLHAETVELSLRFMDEEMVGLYPRYRVICPCGWKGYRIDFITPFSPIGRGVTRKPCPCCKKKSVVAAVRVPHPETKVEPLVAHVFGEIEDEIEGAA